jgi:thiol-disulfide isomerase/thioredoxin
MREESNVDDEVTMSRQPPRGKSAARSDRRAASPPAAGKPAVRAPVPAASPEVAGRSRASRRRKSANPWRLVGLAAAGIVVVIAAIFAWRQLQASSSAGGSDQPVSAAVMTALTTVPDSVTNAVGKGTATSLPIAVRGQPLTGAGNKPEVLYVGAEYCPYCAAERWAMVVALSRFGTFSNLHTARSASDDVFPSTPTFTFYQSSYQSNVIDFQSVELTNSVRQGTSYQPLQSMDAAQQQLFSKYDGPPYVSGGQGSIPFVDMGNQYIVSGAGFDPGSLDNRTWDQIASNLKDPTSADAKNIVGTANTITAAICQATGNQPSSVCTQPAISALTSELAAEKVPSGG